ncbi:extracellular solute-binding protein [Nitratireductor indicus C115]|uniref:Extracellular solute-binding protein n=1 Tax=Nitratireductor indicus C115 TaxID=1231190 RepID=K2NA74_9HYPH|nr:ABC transporter substrate-binding protein [Nitratireductor indicus]EKF44528.1 extracellular solute-binding protein [Nitratireductor indicus C115]SFQ30984.1 peptide/nickel transport system substrate-binding protein [Nitratireductor indicus]
MKHRSLALALMAAVLSGPACAETLKIVMESRLGNLDPILSASHQTREHGYLIYDTLFAEDAQGQAQPQMIDEYSVSEDGKTYRFKLREGLAFHDGAPVTAKDAVASIKRWGQRDRMGLAIMKATDSLEAEDDSTFVLKLNTPLGVVIDAFAKPSGVPLFIMPEAAAATPITEAITNYVGSGPFKFVEDEYSPGVKSIYVKNEDYKPRSEEPSGMAGGKVAKVERIERIEIADPLTAVNSLTEGEVDFMQNVPLDLAPLVEGNEEITTAHLDKAGYQYGYRLNFLHPPFDNKLVRQAALYAVGQKEILQAQFGDADNYQACGAIFGCGTTYESDVMADIAIEAQPEKAKALLAEAGYNGETVLLLHVTDNPAMAAVGPVMAQQLRAAGFNVEMQAMDFMTMLSRRASQEAVDKGGWSIFITSWQVPEVSDPVRSYMIVSEGTKGYAGWGDVPAIDQNIQAFLAEPDVAKRKEIAAEIQKIVYEEGIYAPLGQSSRLNAWTNKVDGLIPNGPTVFWNVTKSAEK